MAADTNQWPLSFLQAVEKRLICFVAICPNRFNVLTVRFSSSDFARLAFEPF